MMPEVCDCTDVCKIPAGQPQPIASCRGLENQIIQDPVERAFDRFLGDVVAALEDKPVDFEGARKRIAEMASRVLRLEPQAREVLLAFLAGLKTALDRIEGMQ